MARLLLFLEGCFSLCYTSTGDALTILYICALFKKKYGVGTKKTESCRLLHGDAWGDRGEGSSLNMSGKQGRRLAHPGAPSHPEDPQHQILR